MAVTLWKLATNVEYRTLSELFGLGRSTVGEIVIETCDAIATHLLPQYVFIPQGDKLRKLLKGLRRIGVFHRLWGLLMVHIYQSYVLMRVHPIIIIVRDITQ